MSNDEFELGELTRMYDLEAALRRYPGLHVRYSEGPEADAQGTSVDSESGLELPGLPVDPLEPEHWWYRPVSDWLARQLCHYQPLHDRHPTRFAWVLTGQQVGRGPDGTPLLTNVLPVARVSAALIEDATHHYRTHFQR